MKNLNCEILNDDALMNVSGGVTTNDNNVNRQSDFDKAWRKAGMEAKGVSGMARAEYYDEWEKTGFKQTAKDFLQSKGSLA